MTPLSPETIMPDPNRRAELLHNSELTAELLARRLARARIATEMHWPEAGDCLLQAQAIARAIVEDLDRLAEHSP